MASALYVAALEETTEEIEAYSLSLTIGALLIADLFATFLFGIATFQTYVFFKVNDRIFYWNKIMVFLVCDNKRGSHRQACEELYTITIKPHPNVGLYARRLWRLFPRHRMLSRVTIVSGLALMILANIILNIFIPLAFSMVKSVYAFINSKRPAKVC
ncbi:hypothetical protein K435DRAFT_842997 [Dendrothele bispora CBS 962.96]|uniref:Uncharacterized protein n=1 Tax=Dendrothele bispora (strain CBS 962.96) TaxID=1314807 RepID=A0A4S8LBJ5_DENBC|nr:hypothetical protein K435DRAFT_842997 [Dendrothele bispora CBS 962.96]